MPAATPEEKKPAWDMKPCPFCAEDIKILAVKCKHCGADLGTKTIGNDKSYRRCLACNYTGKMKTWLRNYNLPQLIIVVLLFFYLIPGIIFMAWGWGKYKCPSCGALAKNVQV